ncbi:hypothetical protein BDN72DRAFT_898002 [Pluteus cervinus]|uniref:Uncharacterized protein n=1 Tax=Pluteus cervinus TaxID=181527 RepID=A0ACD3AS88_9AGAR|nr:hypothetical protein BDN72DRAFT_898002 [Pluteus cervinus]
MLSLKSLFLKDALAQPADTEIVWGPDNETFIQQEGLIHPQTSVFCSFHLSKEEQDEDLFTILYQAFTSLPGCKLTNLSLVEFGKAAFVMLKYAHPPDESRSLVGQIEVKVSFSAVPHKPLLIRRFRQVATSLNLDHIHMLRIHSRSLHRENGIVELVAGLCGLHHIHLDVPNDLASEILLGWSLARPGPGCLTSLHINLQDGSYTSLFDSLPVLQRDEGSKPLQEADECTPS